MLAVSLHRLLSPNMLKRSPPLRPSLSAAEAQASPGPGSTPAGARRTDSWPVYQTVWLKADAWLLLWLLVACSVWSVLQPLWTDPERATSVEIVFVLLSDRLCTCRLLVWTRSSSRQWRRNGRHNRIPAAQSWKWKLVFGCASLSAYFVWRKRPHTSTLTSAYPTASFRVGVGVPSEDMINNLWCSRQEADGRSLVVPPSYLTDH